MSAHHAPTNLADFQPSGHLKKLFARAKFYNQINQKLQPTLPAELRTLSLCLIEKTTAILVSDNAAVVFRAQRQPEEILAQIRRIQGLDFITKIKIKVAVNKTRFKV